MHGQPNICATEGAPGVPSSMVAEYIHPASAVPCIPVLTVSESFLSRSHAPFSGRRLRLGTIDGFPMTLSTAPRRLGQLEGLSDYFMRTRS
jgi:hypothetical protein